MGKKIRRCKKLAIEPERELVTIEETADFLRVRINQVYQWIKDGFIATTQAYAEHNGRLRRKTLIVRQSVKEFLEAGEQ